MVDPFGARREAVAVNVTLPFSPKLTMWTSLLPPLTAPWTARVTVAVREVSRAKKPAASTSRRSVPPAPRNGVIEPLPPLKQIHPTPPGLRRHCDLPPSSTKCCR